MDTLPKLLDHQAETRGDKTAIRFKSLGLWQNLTWDSVLNEVRHFTCGLADLGTVRGDTIAVIGGNTPRIFCAMTACQSLGAIPVPIYGDLAGDEFAGMLEKIAPRYVVAGDQQQVDSVLELKSRGIAPQGIIYTVGRGMSNYDRALVHDFGDIQKRGREYLMTHPEFYTEAVNSGSPDDSAMILFTSGVDDPPKPAVVSHRQILSVTEYLAETEQISDADEVLSFMPIFLPANLLCGYMLSHVVGMCLSCPESTETVMENLREVSPSLMFAPPHVYKQMLASMRERINLTRGLSRKIYDKFMNARARGRHSALGDLLVTAPIRELYGINHLRVALTSGDAINSDVFAFFDSFEVPLKQIYGTAETCGLITMQTTERTDQNVGRAIRGVEVKIADTGEIMCRGENVFSGYYENGQASDVALSRDSWFRTGDIGTLSSDGVLTVLDKLTALGKLSDGTDFRPKIIEKAIKESLYVNEAFVSGDGEQSLVAIITIDSDTVGTWADQHDIRYTGYTDLAIKQEVQGLIKEQVADANQRIADHQPTIKSFLVFHRQWSPQTGELSWTHKLRRNQMKRDFDSMLKAMHNEQRVFEFDDPRSGNRIDFQITSL